MKNRAIPYHKARPRLNARADVLKALAHPVRLFIAEELCQKEICVCELTKRIGMDMSTVSKHLSVLKNAGIIEDEKRGAWVFYCLKMPCLIKICDCVESALKNRALKNMELTQ